ncbi:alpha/beta fold hydrolase [Spongiibacter sp. KMU-166]|uniref:Alpha/beta fold hydrolase n=2 Tax=Spongiibacter thalassae TaxID=2721624 RepID=A0ABX1GB99_9GAMM|nr:alpha/beta fold hydrolase [Spongiibacter thalassae]
MVTWVGRTSGGLPGPRIVQAYIDWLINLSVAPGRQLEILEALIRRSADLVKAALLGSEPTDDRRFRGEGWQKRPYAWLVQAALHRDELARIATEPLPGMDAHNAELVRFYTQQLVDALSPANFALTNPEFVQATIAQRGKNLLRGARFAIGDAVRTITGTDPETAEQFKVGETLATTPGKVVYRNALMELIQYSPSTEDVHAEPILYVPAWIMKYYILDLSPSNSMIRWLVEQGHTVFAISWKNPGKEDSDLSMEDYRTLGVASAMEVIGDIMPERKVHAVGYCVGGTLLMIAAAVMARGGDNRLQSITLFAAQTDFTDAGELRLFIDEMTLYWLEQQMKRNGFLATKQMGGAFAALRAPDLLWQPMLRRYCLGEDNSGFDIMAWNADGTRMPCRMHSDYLRQLYLKNELAQGKYVAGGAAISIGDISAPLYIVGTTADHIAPWESVYKTRNLKKLGETMFCLTKGGHNAGIVSEPGRPRRSFVAGGWDETSAYQSPEVWQASAEPHEGSWWIHWQEWLVGRSSPERTSPPPMGAPDKGHVVLGDAPGTYVFQR